MLIVTRIPKPAALPMGVHEGGLSATNMLSVRAREAERQASLAAHASTCDVRRLVLTVIRVPKPAAHPMGVLEEGLSATKMLSARAQEAERQASMAAHVSTVMGVDLC